MSAESLFWGMMLGAGLWMLVSAVLPPPSKTVLERVAPYLLDVSEAARDIHSPPLLNPLRIAGVVLSPVVVSVADKVDAVLGGKDGQRIVFDGAGVTETFESFRLRRSAHALMGALVGSLAGWGWGVGAMGQVLLLTIGGALAGTLTVISFVDYRLRRTSRLRTERIAEEFPILLELLGLSLAAGDSLPRALLRVAGSARGELGSEWARVMAQVDSGLLLGEALRESAKRLASPPVVAFVEHLAQALDRGAPLAEVISAHSADAHSDYSRSLVDRAGKAEVRMLVPMVLLILPVTVIFAVYPGIQALQFGI